MLPSLDLRLQNDPCYGGTILGASRDYVDADDKNAIGMIADRLKRLQIDGLICVGGDGTLNAMQALSENLPTVLAPKTIDNDLGLNYPAEPDEYVRYGEAAPGTLPPVDPTGGVTHFATSQRHAIWRKRA